MKREFLTYEQSLDMRAIGFNEPCLAYYDKDGDFLGDISVNEDTDNLYTNADFVMYQDFKVADVSAPTFSQAFRFFREKYKMIHQIYSLKDKGGVNYDYEIFSLVLPTDDELGDEDDVATDKSMETYDSLVDKNFKHDESETYEDAELACLKKLIEIVKNETHKN